jgi:hypothetical protein
MSYEHNPLKQQDDLAAIIDAKRAAEAAKTEREAKEAKDKADADAKAAAAKLNMSPAWPARYTVAGVVLVVSGLVGFFAGTLLGGGS